MQLQEAGATCPSWLIRDGKRIRGSDVTAHSDGESVEELLYYTAAVLLRTNKSPSAI